MAAAAAAVAAAAAAAAAAANKHGATKRHMKIDGCYYTDDQTIDNIPNVLNSFKFFNANHLIIIY